MWNRIRMVLSGSGETPAHHCPGELRRLYVVSGDDPGTLLVRSPPGQDRAEGHCGFEHGSHDGR